MSNETEGIGIIPAALIILDNYLSGVTDTIGESQTVPVAVLQKVDMLVRKMVDEFRPDAEGTNEKENENE